MSLRDLVESKIKKVKKVEGEDPLATLIFLMIRELHMSLKEILVLQMPQFYYLVDCLTRDIEEKNKAYKKQSIRRR